MKAYEIALILEELIIACDGVLKPIEILKAIKSIDELL